TRLKTQDSTQCLSADGVSCSILSVTTGDWVLVDERASDAVIHHVFERRTVLWRRAAGGAQRQAIASNVDVFFIVTSANSDLNPRRIERYLTAPRRFVESSAWSSTQQLNCN